jgi:hypothetical protein
MATFLSASLSHSLTSDRVLLRVDARVRFQPHELNTMWFLEMQFMEEDTVFDDNLGTHRGNFLTSAAEVDVSFSISKAKSTVNTEWGNEEVFANLIVVPLQAPPPFALDQATTNGITVKV